MTLREHAVKKVLSLGRGVDLVIQLTWKFSAMSNYIFGYPSASITLDNSGRNKTNGFLAGEGASPPRDSWKMNNYKPCRSRKGHTHSFTTLHGNCYQLHPCACVSAGSLPKSFNVLYICFSNQIRCYSRRIIILLINHATVGWLPVRWGNPMPGSVGISQGGGV